MIEDPLNDHLTPPHCPGAASRLLATVLAIAFGATLLLAGGTPASATVTIPADPDAPVEGPSPSDVAAQRKEVKRLARQEVNRKVRERRSDNVPRYRYGRGRIAPYGFQRGAGGPWCAAFATWAWGRAGFESFRKGPVSRRAQLLRTTFTGEVVAVQVRDLRTWAKGTKRWTVFANPG
jgi:hypothetical protein